MSHFNSPLHSAVVDFRNARRRANLETIFARLAGRPTGLLSYDDVKEKLRARGGASRGLQDIPLEAIVGSVGRYSDFTRSFLPRRSLNAQRWAKVKHATLDATGVPPIEVYKISDVYFVLDGNHRVSVARQMKNKTIQGYVTEVYTQVPLTPKDKPDALILKSRYATFLEETHLERLRPDADLTTSAPGHYRILAQQIEEHHRILDQEKDVNIDKDTAVCDWYDQVYLPIVQIMREQVLLREFPDRTETDLYVWLFEHMDALKEELGWSVEHRRAVTYLAARTSPTTQRVAARIRSKVTDALTPDPLESGPQAGEWRKVQSTANPDEQLTCDILVPINGKADGWIGLEQAITVAQREGSRLCGLYVVPTFYHLENPKSQNIQDEFAQRCKKAGVSGDLVVEMGSVARTICDRARWTDLVVLNLSHPPGSQPFSRLKSGFRTMLLRSPTPVLVVPEIVTAMNRGLLAYDGSPKAEEALFVATHLATQWSMPLVVVTVSEQGEAHSKPLIMAQRYLEEHNLEATFVGKSGSAADIILDTANEYGSNLIIMGGYGRHAVLQAVLGSTLDEVLRNAFQPVLVCR
ncbi:MAG: universal stress protein [Chloroflexota bacterium]